MIRRGGDNLAVKSLFYSDAMRDSPHRTVIFRRDGGGHVLCFNDEEGASLFAMFFFDLMSLLVVFVLFYYIHMYLFILLKRYVICRPSPDTSGVPVFNCCLN